MFAFNFANDPDTDEAEEEQTVPEDKVELKQAQEILVNLVWSTCALFDQQWIISSSFVFRNCSSYVIILLLLLIEIFTSAFSSNNDNKEIHENILNHGNMRLSLESTAMSIY